MRLSAPVEAGLSARSETERRALAFARHGAPAIGNVESHIVMLDTGHHLFPVTVNNGDESADNSYVASPLTAYTGYAEYEIRQLDRPWLTWPLLGLTRAAGGWLARARIDRIVQVNNWLLSTNLYPPDWDGADLPAITDYLLTVYPDHAIGFRSLNRYSNAGLIARLEARGYLAIPSRQVYLFDGAAGKDAGFLRRRDSRRDARLLVGTPYQRVSGQDLSDADYPRLEHLYNLLYLDKYCPLNPHFTAGWMRSGQRDGWLELTALRTPAGRIDAVLGWFANETVMTSPVVGYDTALPQKTGLYRLISQISLEETARRCGLFNMSAGAAGFKRLRGGRPEIEYSYVFVDHLPAYRKRTWRLLGSLLRGVGVPIMEKYEL